MAVLFGADRERAEKELKQSVEFEMALANVSIIIKTSIFRFIIFIYFRFPLQMKNVVMQRLYTIQ